MNARKPISREGSDERTSDESSAFSRRAVGAQSRAAQHVGRGAGSARRGGGGGAAAGRRQSESGHPGRQGDRPSRVGAHGYAPPRTSDTAAYGPPPPLPFCSAAN